MMTGRLTTRHARSARAACRISSALPAGIGEVDETRSTALQAGLTLRAHVESYVYAIRASLSAGNASRARWAVAEDA